ncbi:hypothetical protein ACFXB3_30640 [Streptomyces sp. NPDC059447]|uniref:hypothetical protein n=1 Tax=unclassified Streptomyces TaxID=2593676 RepID=UPI0036955C22
MRNMRNTRTALAGVLCSAAAAAALVVGSAGQAAADEVPWTGPVPVVITGVVGGVAGAVDDIAGAVGEVPDTIEVPWT